MPALNESTTTFVRINRGYNQVFQPNRLSVGLVAPLELYQGTRADDGAPP